MIACARAGIPVMVVPGITSAVAVPAAAGVPVTHRGVSQEFHVISVHVAPDDPKSTVDWPGLARSHGTLVLMMAVERLGKVAETLVRDGRSPETPVMVVQDGTLPTQRAVIASLVHRGRPRVRGWDTATGDRHRRRRRKGRPGGRDGSSGALAVNTAMDDEHDEAPGEQTLQFRALIDLPADHDAAPPSTEADAEADEAPKDDPPRNPATPSRPAPAPDEPEALRRSDEVRRLPCCGEPEDRRLAGMTPGRAAGPGHAEGVVRVFASGRRGSAGRG